MARLQPPPHFFTPATSSPTTLRPTPTESLPNSSAPAACEFSGRLRHAKLQARSSTQNCPE
eukprot:2945398-Alexandrium_andersonii.AAC.1